jgi:hypothetical protein
MNKYIIELSCWDGSTQVEMELNDSQKEAIEILSKKTHEKSENGSQPTLRIGSLLQDRDCPVCGTRMKQDIEDYYCEECFYAIRKDEL